MSGAGEKKFSAIMLNNGQLISIAKKATDEVKHPDSNALLDEDFGELYSTGKVARPPYNPRYLASLLETNTYHDRCVKQKAADIVGCGFDLEEVDKGEKDKKKDPKYKEIIDFFENCHPVMTFPEIVTQAWIDYESIGWLVIEVLRTQGGDKKIARLEHIPASTCRISLDHELPGIIQKRNLKERYFKFFGDKEERIDPNTKAPASEVIFMAQYHPSTDYYGLPDYISAIGAMVANIEIRDFNIEFFDNNAVPDYAVILEGGEPDETFEEVVKSYFTNNLKGKGKHHKTLVLSAPEGGKIKFEPLAVDVKDGHFRSYRLDCRDEVINAHGVPSYRIGITETGSLGGSTASESNKIYKSSVVNPRQEKFENRINKLIKFGLMLDGWKFKFSELDLTDKKLDADIEKIKAETSKIVVESSVMTPDEARYTYHDTEKYNDSKDIPDEVKEWAKLPAAISAAKLAQSQTPPQDQQTLPNDPKPQKPTEPADPKFEKEFDSAWQSEVKRQKLNIKKYIPQDNWTSTILKAFKKKVKKDIFAEQDKLCDKMKTSLTALYDDMEKATLLSVGKMDIKKLIPNVDQTVEKGLSIEQADQIISMYPEAYQQLALTMNYMEVASLLYILMEEGISIGKETAIDDLGKYSDLIDWNQYDKRTSIFLDNYVFKASQITMDRLIGDVIGKIKESMELGESIPQMQTRIKEVFTSMREFETERIARTEAAKSANWARWQAFVDAGKKFKKWKTNIDNRERDSHRSINGQVRAMDKSFSNKLMYPGDPNGKIKEVVNCRCSIFWCDNADGTIDEE